MKIFAKALEFNLALGYSQKTSNSTRINININFVDIYTDPEHIIPGNLYVCGEGFWHLSNIIKQICEKNSNPDPSTNIKTYSKIKEFAKSHLISLSKGHFTIDMGNKNKNYYTIKEDIYNFKNHPEYNPVDTYNIIMGRTFAGESGDELIYTFFNNNLTYGNFQKFINMLLFYRDNIEFLISKTNDNIINKFIFTIIQYNKIAHCNYLVLSNLKKFIYLGYDRVLKNTHRNPEIKSISDNNIMINHVVLNFVKYKDLIIKHILDSYESTYVKYHGITLCSEYKYINKHVMAHIMHDLENKLMDLFIELNDPKNKTVDIDLDNSINSNELSVCTYVHENSDEYDQDLSDNASEHDSDEIISLVKFILGKIIAKISKEIATNKQYHFPLYVKKFIYLLLITNNENNDTSKYKNYKTKLDDIISINTCVHNFAQYKVYYTWEDYLKIEQYYNNVYGVGLGLGLGSSLGSHTHSHSHTHSYLTSPTSINQNMELDLNASSGSQASMSPQTSPSPSLITIYSNDNYTQDSETLG